MSGNSSALGKKDILDFDIKESKMATAYMTVMVGFHILCLLAFVTGVSWTAFWIAFAMYVIRGMGVTVGYHRFFAHRSFKTSRIVQYFLGLAGTLSMQGGVLWWASHHRGHHKHSDLEGDLHSPVINSFFHSHMGWMWNKECFKPAKYKCHDLAKFPEIKFLNRAYAPILLLQAVLLYILGEILNAYFPGLGTNGFQVLVWSVFISTVFLWHITFCINSICHVFGKKRYKFTDQSRNNWFVALFSFGEGWHNNHHMYGWSARNGFKWYEYDVSYYFIKVMSWLGIFWDVKLPTKEQMNENLL